MMRRSHQERGGSRGAAAWPEAPAAPKPEPRVLAPRARAAGRAQLAPRTVGVVPARSLLGAAPKRWGRRASAAVVGSSHRRRMAARGARLARPSRCPGRRPPRSPPRDIARRGLPRRRAGSFRCSSGRGMRRRRAVLSKRRRAPVAPRGARVATTPVDPRPAATPMRLRHRAPSCRRWSTSSSDRATRRARRRRRAAPCWRSRHPRSRCAAGPGRVRENCSCRESPVRPSREGR